MRTPKPVSAPSRKCSLRCVSVHNVVCASLLIVDVHTQQSAELVQAKAEVNQLKIQNRRNVLRSRLNRWLQIQPSFVPGVLSVRGLFDGTGNGLLHLGDNHVDADFESPENFPLFLPSQILAEQIDVNCPERLVKIEGLLRTAQALDALEQVKHNLCTYQSLVKYKITQVSNE